METVEETTCRRYTGREWVEQPTSVARETPLTIYINRKELVTVLCTPVRLNCLVLGFLYSEGIITSIKDVGSMRVCDDEIEANVQLTRDSFEMPQSRTLTSGCGGGALLGERQLEELRVNSELRVDPEQVPAMMKQLLDAAQTHKDYGGIHTAVMSDGYRTIVAAEDIGRHNTIDKIKGECMLRNIPTKDRVLVSTGRISSEMLFKAGKMQVPVVISRSAITSRAISLARDLGITAVGYTRGDKFTVYSHPERIG